MGKNSRFRINLSRKRFNAWKNHLNKVVIISFTCVLFIAIISVSILANTNKDKTVISSIDKSETNSTLEKEDITEGVQSSLAIDENGKEILNGTETNPLKEENNKNESEEKIPSNIVTMSILGEMMMGGNVTTNLNYMYNSAFKSIHNITRYSDFTYTTLSTLITNLNEIKDAKSKYIVTKEILNALSSLGVDIVNLASDHMTDFDKNILSNTIDILKNKEINISGLDGNTLYLEANGKKISIVSSNNVYIGIKNTYRDYGINIYESNKFKKDILEAKANSDFVIADIHWGREYIFGVTTEMNRIAKEAVDSGAGLVIGSHALGNYPIVTYNNVPIIYSAGYIMTDSDMYLAKTSYIYNININKYNKLDKLEMIPIYIKEKTVTLLYNEYNQELCNEFNNQMNNWNNENGIDSKIIENKLIVEF